MIKIEGFVWEIGVEIGKFYNLNHRTLTLKKYLSPITLHISLHTTHLTFDHGLTPEIQVQQTVHITVRYRIEGVI